MASSRSTRAITTSPDSQPGFTQKRRGFGPVFSYAFFGPSAFRGRRIREAPGRAEGDFPATQERVPRRARGRGKLPPRRPHRQLWWEPRAARKETSPPRKRSVPRRARGRGKLPPRRSHRQLWGSPGPRGRGKLPPRRSCRQLLREPRTGRYPAGQAAGLKKMRGGPCFFILTPRRGTTKRKPGPDAPAFFLFSFIPPSQGSSWRNSGAGSF